MPLFERWSAHIEPGALKEQIFSALGWLPTAIDIAGGTKGDGVKQKTNPKRTGRPDNGMLPALFFANSTWNFVTQCLPVIHSDSAKYTVSMTIDMVRCHRFPVNQ
ncbi:MAG: hypothetical protein PVF07_07895 [Thiogranum sp.]